MKQFPYQYLAAYRHADPGVPDVIRQALCRAAETACGNVPELPGSVIVGLDVSGSMASPVTGQRGRGATTALRCVDVAAVFAAAVLRRNPDSVVVPFGTQAYGVDIDPAAPILALADRLAQYGGGGTDCSTPLAHANRRLADRPFVGCVLVSDNESWVGTGRGGATAVLTEWERFAARQRRHGVADPKLVCIDVQPYATTQAPDRDDVLNVGGFSDAVFDVVAAFLAGDPARFGAEVGAVKV